MDPEAYLEIVVDSQPGKVPLARGAICQIGRGEENTLVLDDHQVSRNHAMVQSTPSGEFYLSDLGSRNGTLVNRSRITAPVLLRPGDRISIGQKEFVFRGPATAAPARAERGGTVVDMSLRLVTILVTDVRDFTGLSRRLGETRISQLLGAFFQDAGRILSGHQAWGQKYIGDGVMAIWLHQRPVPEVGELTAVFASLDELFAVAAGLAARFDLDAPVRIGAGINTGFGCVGNIGSDASADYTAMSDAVNLTFRLESATKDLGCDLVVGPETYRYLGGHLDARHLFAMQMAQLKGYEEPRQVYTSAQGSVGAVLESLRSKADTIVTQTTLV